MLTQGTGLTLNQETLWMLTGNSRGLDLSDLCPMPVSSSCTSDTDCCWCTCDNTN